MLGIDSGDLLKSPGCLTGNFSGTLLPIQKVQHLPLPDLSSSGLSGVDLTLPAQPRRRAERPPALPQGADWCPLPAAHRAPPAHEGNIPCNGARACARHPGPTRNSSAEQESASLLSPSLPSTLPTFLETAVARATPSRQRTSSASRALASWRRQCSVPAARSRLCWVASSRWRAAESSPFSTRLCCSARCLA